MKLFEVKLMGLRPCYAVAENAGVAYEIARLSYRELESVRMLADEGSTFTGNCGGVPKLVREVKQ